MIFFYQYSNISVREQTPLFDYLRTYLTILHKFYKILFIYIDDISLCTIYS